MKITYGQLRRAIREEMTALHEVDPERSTAGKKAAGKAMKTRAKQYHELDEVDETDEGKRKKGKERTPHFDMKKCMKDNSWAKDPAAYCQALFQKKKG